MAGCLLFISLHSFGCQSSGGVDVSSAVASGQLGTARARVAADLTEDRADRRYLIDRMTLALVTLYDGYPRVAQPHFEQVYDILRTQGVNADKTVDSVVFYEGMRFWKGEPFEQAMAQIFYGMQQAQLGQWDNLRAASASSLFSLKDWTGDMPARQIDTDDIAERARIREAARARGDDPDEAERQAGERDKGYAVVESNFVLGYLLHAVASQQLGRVDEAADFYRAAAGLNPAIEPTVQRLASGQYNTVLVVGYGLGPRKQGTGPDGSVEVFVPRVRSDRKPLVVRVAGQNETATEGGADAPADGGPQSVAWATDVNQMAASYLWRNGQAARQIKSLVGSGLTAAGAIVVGQSLNDESLEGAAIGAGIIAAGLLLKASAQADQRYLRVLPQRLYVVPLTVTEPDTRVRLSLGNSTTARLTLFGLQPPTGGQAAFRYVHLPDVPWQAAWLDARSLVYGNDAVGPVNPSPWPYPLGGDDARTPSASAVAQWRAAHPGSVLERVTPVELESAYRDAGLTWDPAAPEALGPHLLEGGKSLLAPMAGTTGFTRLFAQPHPPYNGPLKLPGPATPQAQP